MSQSNEYSFFFICFEQKFLDMAAFDLKKFVPHLLSILVIFVVTFLFFKPEFTDGLSLKQDDMLNYRGVVQELKAFQAKTGEVSMWSGSMFSGIPAYIFFPTFNYGVLPYVEKAFKGFMSDSAGGHIFCC